MGWYNKGFDGAEEQIAATQNNFTRDFFLKDGEEVTVRFLDDESFNIRDHFVKGKGWFTCCGEGCALCEAGNKPTNHFIFNVFDAREYTDKAGNLHKDEVKIWRVGVMLFRVLKKKASKYGPLTTLDVDVSRMGSGTKSSWDVEVSKAAKKVTLPSGVEKYNLEEVLTPKSREDLQRILNNEPVVAPKSGNDDDDDDDSDVDWSKA